MADRAGNATDKASWLRLAASWLGMIKAERPFENKPPQEKPAQSEEAADNRWPDPSKDDSQASH